MPVLPGNSDRESHRPVYECHASRPLLCLQNTPHAPTGCFPSPGPRGASDCSFLHCVPKSTLLDPHKLFLGGGQAYRESSVGTGDRGSRKAGKGHRKRAGQSLPGAGSCDEVFPASPLGWLPCSTPTPSCAPAAAPLPMEALVIPPHFS